MAHSEEWRKLKFLQATNISFFLFSTKNVWKFYFPEWQIVVRAAGAPVMKPGQIFQQYANGGRSFKVV